MSDENKVSLYQQHGDDLEAGRSRRDHPEDEDGGTRPVDIVRPKSDPVHGLRRWRAALVLKACLRFWYTLDLKKEEERKQLIAKSRMHAQVTWAAALFQDAVKGLHSSGTSTFPSTPTPTVDFGISSEELVSISREQDIPFSRQNGLHLLIYSLINIVLWLMFYVILTSICAE